MLFLEPSCAANIDGKLFRIGGVLNWLDRGLGFYSGISEHRSIYDYEKSGTRNIGLKIGSGRGIDLEKFGKYGKLLMLGVWVMHKSEELLLQT